MISRAAPQPKIDYLLKTDPHYPPSLSVLGNRIPESYLVLDVFFASPTARGAATMVRTKLRHLLTGAVLEKSFRSSEKFAEPDVELSLYATVPLQFCS